MRRALYAIGLLCAWLPLQPGHAGVSADGTRSSHGGSTAWHLNLPVLASLGVQIESVQQQRSMPASSKHGSYRNLTFDALDLGGFRFSESAGLPRALSGGAMQHAGGFVLAFPGGHADLRGFALRRNAAARFALDVVDVDGHTWFTLERGHYQLEDDNRTLAMRYMNLHLSAYFARQLKRPEFTGLGVGGVDALSPVSDSDAIAIVGSTCNAPWPGQNGAQADIRMIYQSADAESGAPDAVHFRRCGLPDAGGVYHDADCTQTSTDRGVVFAPDTSLLNAGSAAVAWHQMFSHPDGVAGYPPYGNDQHPFLVWNLYRIDGAGVLRQLAASGVKHAFNTINQACGCADHTNNYPTCEDSYSQYSNDVSAETVPNYLGPRVEVIPATAQWGRCKSVFDKDCDAAQDIDAGAQDDYQYRLIARESDLLSAQPPAQFLFEYWYVVRDQVNIYDAMGYRPLSLSKVAGGGNGAYLWQANALTFGDGSNFRNGAVINYWVDPVAPSPGSLNQELVTPEGRARVAVRTTALGGGLYRYDYAVMNFDFSRAVIDPAHAQEPNMHVVSNDGFSAFSVPLPTGAKITSLAFDDNDDDPGNDWTPSTDGAGVRWRAPSAHPLNWGTLYRFSFTADRAPAPASVQLDVATAGSPASYATAMLVPAIDDIFRDGFDG